MIDGVTEAFSFLCLIHTIQWMLSLNCGSDKALGAPLALAPRERKKTTKSEMSQRKSTSSVCYSLSFGHLMTL